MKLKGIWESASIQVQIMYLTIMMLFCFILFSLIGAFGVFLIGTHDLYDLSSKETILTLKWMQGCAAIGLFLVPSLLFSYTTKHSFGFNKVNRQQIMLVIAMMLLVIPGVSVLAEWNQKLHFPEILSGLENLLRSAEYQATRMTDAFLLMDSPIDLIINLLIIAALPAIGEELFFRGVLQKLFVTWNGKIHFSVWLTAFLFSAMHFQFLGFVPRFLLGGVLGYLLVWSGSLWLPIIAHFTNNAIAIIALYFVESDYFDSNMDFVGSEGSFSLFISVLGALILLYFIKETAVIHDE